MGCGKGCIDPVEHTGLSLGGLLVFIEHLLCWEVPVRIICLPHGFGQVAVSWALLFSFVKSWAWGLGVGGKIMCWSPPALVFSWNLLCVLARFAPLKEMSEN